MIPPTLTKEHVITGIKNDILEGRITKDTILKEKKISERILYGGLGGMAVGTACFFSALYLSPRYDTYDTTLNFVGGLFYVVGFIIALVGGTSIDCAMAQDMVYTDLTGKSVWRDGLEDTLDEIKEELNATMRI